MFVILRKKSLKICSDFLQILFASKMGLMDDDEPAGGRRQDTFGLREIGLNLSTVQVRLSSHLSLRKR